MARQLVDMGVDIFWGHSNHTPQGLEIYKGKPILYSTGDFVDDYAVDPRERNDLSFLFLVETRYRKIVKVRLYSVAIENFRVRRARGSEISFLQKTMKENCAAFTTNIEFQNDIGTVLVG
jgi:poly-gamma-glutamate synthesis protein (capsule biosynthesis protein)